MQGIDSSFSSHGAEHQGLVSSRLVSPHLLTQGTLKPLVLFRVILKLFLKPPTASKPSLARGAELHFSSDPGADFSALPHPSPVRSRGGTAAFGWPLCHPLGFVSHSWGHLGVSGITAWPWALGALPDCLSQLGLGAHPGMLGAGREAGMCQGGCGSFPVRIGCSGVGFAHPLPLKQHNSNLLLVFVSPFLFPTILSLFPLGLDLKRAVKIRKNSTNVFPAVSNWELNPKTGSEQGCAALSSAGNQGHPLDRHRGAHPHDPRASWDGGDEVLMHFEALRSWAEGLRSGLCG